MNQAGAMHLSVIFAAIVSLAAPADIQKSMDAFVAHAPGAVVAVGVVDHGTVREYFSGKPPAGAPPLDDAAVFQIGSITKTMTSTVLADMVLHGQVKLDDSISTYLPASVKAPSYRGQPVKLLSLAVQNSGLPRLPSNFDSAYTDYDNAKLYQFLDGYSLTRAPGARFEYSNLGVGLLGTLLANAAHTTYPRLLEEHVLRPLGMTNTSASLTPSLEARLMPGFGNDFTKQPAWAFEALAGAGAVNSTLHDMVSYLRANIDAPAGPLGKAIAFAHQPRADAMPPEKIGLNWFIGPSGVVFHDGETGGYSSFIAFDSASKTGVVVLTNFAGERGETDSLAAHLLESTRYPSFVAIAPLKPEGRSPFVGVYEFSPTIHATIFEKSGTLYGQLTGQGALALTLQSGRTFAVQGVAASVTFVRDANGNIDALVLHQGGIDQTAKRLTP